MSNFVDYAKNLMEVAKGFASKAKNETDVEIEQAYLRASLLHGFFFLEAHLNDLAEHFQSNSMFSIHEQGILLERDVGFDNGEFRSSDRRRHYRITERVELLLRKCSSDYSKSKGTWFSKLSGAIKIRNKIVHPRDVHTISHKEVSASLVAIIDCVDELYRVVFKKGLPYKNKSMDGGLKL
jgi:hypothetical protein